jgi:hypothetical protein
MLIAALANLLSGNILGLVVSLVIGFYFMFQVREYYK